MDKCSVDQRSTFSALAHHFGAKPNISRPSLIVSLLDDGEKGSKTLVCPEVTRPMALNFSR